MVLLPMRAYAACPAYRSMETKMACRTSSEEPVRKKDLYQTIAPQDNFFTQLQQKSLQKVEALQKDPKFQEIVKALQNNSPQPQNTAASSSPETQGNLRETSLYIFVSFSMSEKALLNIAHEAKRFGATLVLRGFKEGSYLKTAQGLQNIIIKTGQGVIVDPELYVLFKITAVPSFVLAKPFQLYSAMRIQTPLHDKLQGHVSIHYVLETFAKRGDLKDEAQKFLRMGGTK